MYTIMICDDEKIERDYIKSVINKYQSKYKLIGEASNGQQIIELAFKYNPDIIIMDIKMPIYDGLEAAKIIKLKFEDMIILLNSAYGEFEFAQKAIDYSLDGYLLKPSSEAAIIKAITSSLDKRVTKDELYEKSNYSKEVDEYPYSLVENILRSIYLRDIKLLQNKVKIYFDFIKLEKQNLMSYRLHIINTMFSIITLLQNLISTQAYKIICNYNYLLKISRKNNTCEILDITEDFFDLLISILDEEFKFNNNCEDIIQAYIDKYFQEEITLEKLSNICHFNSSYISRIFHHNKKITINAYINKKRIEYAINLLKNSNLLIKDIAFESGFINISHFNRVFKDITGEIPSNIKRKVNE